MLKGPWIRIRIRNPDPDLPGSSIFGHQNPGSGMDPDPDPLEMLVPDPYSDSMNPDPKHTST